ncbi:MAG: hypothetical protein NTY32_06035 [Bacteroidia bacterium]|nr:hypothetical protein [Bacteroidia bacterium]
MENNDYFFYLVVAVSVIGYIVKAFKKKPDENQTEPKTSIGGDILKKILAEMQEKDDYIPRNPVPASTAKPVVKQPAPSPSAGKPHVASVRSGNVEKGYVTPEVKERNVNAASTSRNQIFEPVEESMDPLMASIDLSSGEEMKKAIIYSEILRPKF